MPAWQYRHAVQMCNTHSVSNKHTIQKRSKHAVIGTRYMPYMQV
jgi:hypothetical protein